MGVEIEKLFYINLDIRTDRRASIENQLRVCSLPYERFPAAYFEHAEDVPNDIIVYDKIADYNLRISRGTIGCMMSHLEILKEIVKLNTKNVCIVLEDDVVLLPNFISSIQTISFPEERDLVLVDCWSDKGFDASKRVHGASNLYDTSMGWPFFGGTHCCLIFGSNAAGNILNRLRDVDGEGKIRIGDIDQIYIEKITSKYIWCPNICYQNFTFTSDRTT